MNTSRAIGSGKLKLDTGGWKSGTGIEMKPPIYT